MIWSTKLLWYFSLVSMFCHTNKMAREIILEEGASHFVLTVGWKSLILNFLNSSSRLSRRTCRSRRCWSAGAHILYLHLDIFFFRERDLAVFIERKVKILQKGDCRTRRRRRKSNRLLITIETRRRAKGENKFLQVIFLIHFNHH